MSSLDLAVGNIRRCYNQVAEIAADLRCMDVPLGGDYWVVYHFLSHLGSRVPSSDEISGHTRRIFGVRKRLLSHLERRP